jgi:hypothetical protein
MEILLNSTLIDNPSLYPKGGQKLVMVKKLRRYFVKQTNPYSDVFVFDEKSISSFIIVFENEEKGIK